MVERPYNTTQKTPTFKQPPMSKRLVTVRRIVTIMTPSIALLKPESLCMAFLEGLYLLIHCHVIPSLKSCCLVFN